MATDRNGWEPKVGDGATMSIGSDRYPYRVVRVSGSGKTIWMKPLQTGGKVSDDGVPGGPMRVLDEVKDNSEEIRASLRNHGRFQRSGWNSTGYVSPGARSYSDPGF